jgi:hypothetical protein
MPLKPCYCYRLFRSDGIDALQGGDDASDMSCYFTSKEDAKDAAVCDLREHDCKFNSYNVYSVFVDYKHLTKVI